MEHRWHTPNTAFGPESRGRPEPLPICEEMQQRDPGSVEAAASTGRHPGAGALPLKIGWRPRPSLHECRGPVGGTLPCEAHGRERERERERERHLFTNHRGGGWQNFSGSFLLFARKSVAENFLQ